MPNKKTFFNISKNRKRVSPVVQTLQVFFFNAKTNKQKTTQKNHPPKKQNTTKT